MLERREVVGAVIRFTRHPDALLRVALILVLALMIAKIVTAPRLTDAHARQLEIVQTQ